MAPQKLMNATLVSELLKTPAKTNTSLGSNPEVREVVENVIADIRVRGDVAVREYSVRFDNHGPETFLLDQKQLAEIIGRVPAQVIEDIEFVQKQVRFMAEKQLETLQDFEVETLPGVFLGQKQVPINAAGVYIPGGKYPLLASAHMTIITAKVAGVARVAACRERFLMPPLLPWQWLVPTRSIFSGGSKLLRPWPLAQRRLPR
jgi:sulfopropanediol 3-dehydrogenase